MRKQSSSNNTLLLILVTYAAFISLGLPDGLLGVAWPFMSEKFNVPLDSLGILLIAFVLGYLSTSTTSAKIITIVPLGVLLIASCAITGVGLLLYAFLANWFLIIIASFFLGAGGGAIDSSINSFAASNFSPSVVNWLHSFYGVGATTGPLIMTWMFDHNHGWNWGYITVGIIQLLLSGIFLMTLKYWKATSETEKAPSSGLYKEIFHMPKLWLNVLIFFLYTGIEIGVGQWIFTVLTQSRKINVEEAGLWTSAYWGSLTAGRIIFGFVLTRLSVRKVISGALIGIVFGTLLVAINESNFITLLGIMIIGISNAPVFPCMISITPATVGEKYAAHAVGFQISAAMIGGALLPGFAGVIADSFGLEWIPKLFMMEAVLLWMFYLIALKSLKLKA